MAKKRKPSPKKSTPRKRAPKKAVENPFNRLALTGVRLLAVESQFQMKGGKLPTEFVISSETGVAESSTPGNIHVVVTASVEGRPKDAAEGDDSSIARVSAVYQCVYSAPEVDLTSYIAQAPAICANGMLVAWPYLRELIHGLTARMGIPPFTLPVMLLQPGKPMQIGPADSSPK
jgi:hypothetical protein